MTLLSSRRRARPKLSSRGSRPKISRTVGRGRGAQAIGAIGLLLVLLLVWQFLVPTLGIPSYVMPVPTDVVVALLDPTALPRYVSNGGATMTVVLSGLAIGVGLGLVLALVLAQLPALHNVVFPYIVALESVPKIALAPLFLIWFGFGLPSKIVVVVLVAFFPVLVSTIHGLRSVDRDQIDLFRVNGARPLQIRMRLMVPAALPMIFSGLELAVTNAMIGGIVAEFVGAQHGLGVLILQAQGQMQTPAVFALLIILSLLGIILNLVVRLLRRIVIRWES